MEITVYYNSKTGFTKKYADWIAEELKCDVFPFKDFVKMGFIDRGIIKMVGKLIGGKKNKTETENRFTEAIKKSHDISSRDYIKPLVEFVNKFLTLS